MFILFITGVLFVRLSLANVSSSHLSLYDAHASEIGEAITLHQDRLARDNRDFYHFVRNWLSTVVEARPFLSSRVIKLLAEDETGRAHTTPYHTPHHSSLALSHTHLHAHTYTHNYIIITSIRTMHLL